MNLTLTERDKKLLGLTACLAILAVFGVHLIRPALAEHEALGSEYEAALQKQQECFFHDKCLLSRRDAGIFVSSSDLDAARAGKFRVRKDFFRNIHA